MAPPKPEAPKPDYHSPLHDEKLEKLLSEYQGWHTEEAERKASIEVGHDKDKFRDTVYSALAKHGKNDDGTYKRYSFHDMGDTDRRKWSEDLVHKLALMGVEKEFGADLKKVYAKNNSLLRQYIEQQMIQGVFRSYEEFIEHVGNSENIKDGWESDQRLSRVRDSYMENINKRSKRVEELQTHFAIEHNYDGVADYVDTIVGKHDKRVKRTRRNLSGLLQEIQGNARGIAPRAKARHLEDKPKSKK